MRTFFICILCLSSALLLPFLKIAQAEERSVDLLKSKIDLSIANKLESKTGAGVVVGLIDQGRTYIWSYGQGNLNFPTRPKSNSIFEVGSITKVFTGIVLARMLGEGLVDLNAPIYKYLPEFSASPLAKVTLRQLVTHTSGLPKVPMNLDFSNMLNPYQGYSKQLLFDFLKECDLLPQPKLFSIENYSNLGFGLLAHLLSRVSGQEFKDLIKNYITSPLRMDDTVIQIPAERHERVVQGYDQGLYETPFWDFGALEAAGGLHSTVTDLLTFVSKNLRPDDSPLGQALKLSHSMQVEGHQNNMGLAWFMGKSGTPTEDVIFHEGITGGFQNVIGFNKKKGLGLVILTNSNFSVEALYQMIFSFRSISEVNLSAMVGNYRLKDPFFGQKNVPIEIIMKGKVLIARMNKQLNLRLNPTGDLEFDVGEGLGKIKFDQKGIQTYDQFKFIPLPYGNEITAERM